MAHAGDVRDRWRRRDKASARETWMEKYQKNMGNEGCSYTERAQVRRPGLCMIEIPPACLFSVRPWRPAVGELVLPSIAAAPLWPAYRPPRSGNGGPSGSS
jgi:hypothetical protein